MNKTDRPLVSFVILTYNQERYIGEAIKGALSQTYENMEIIVSDDCSTDHTYDRAQQTIEEYKGEKNIRLLRNEANMGLVPHVNKILNLCEGVYIALAGGDDISLPTRIERSVDLLEDERVTATCGQSEVINEKGETVKEAISCDVSYWKINDEYVRDLTFMTGGFGLTFKREVFFDFGDLNPKTPGEDSTLRFRALLMGSLAVSGHCYIKYRVHSGQMSGSILSLKTKDMAKQYSIDARKAYEMGLIDKRSYQRVKKKIWLYRVNRTIQEWKHNKPVLIRFAFRVMQEITILWSKWI